ncbi:hypothetical protein CASFOL_030035 [Castilleja foliolosa]|uniref:F-box domain-containing protein n=1 Tax=Castilleja foliolosa TaxID=1961234 RepID=A0ABD3CBN1_9LAMI
MTNIESLPDDVISEILVRIPAQDLFDSTRLVCRKWYNIINTRNFAYSHLQLSIPKILAVDIRTFMTMQNGQIETSKLSYELGRCTILSSCNGLILLGFDRNSNSLGQYIITNPVTKQQFALPKFVSREPMKYDYHALAYVASPNSLALAYVASSRVYKVVCVSGLECAIMTVGVDTDWGRHVSTQHLTVEAKELLKWYLLKTRGFLHWVNNQISEYVLTMNVESETIMQIPGPCLRNKDYSLKYRYLVMGSYLSLLIGRGQFSWEWELWKMKPETGEWTKMPRIVLEHQEVLERLSFKFKGHGFPSTFLIPVCWSNSGEVLFFYVCSRVHYVKNWIFLAYNIRTREFDLWYPQDSSPTLFLDHRSSLVWLD